MRSAKTEGGLINITHREAARIKWLLTAHIMAQYTEALRCLTVTYSGIWSQQQTEVRPAAMKLHTFLHFSQMHNPLATDNSSQLDNIATRLITDEHVNVEEAVSVGQKIHGSMTDVT